MQAHQTRAVAILNASSGWESRAEAGEQLREILLRSGIDCEVWRVEAGADIHDLAARAVSSGAQVVLAGGGDGTLRAVASALAGTGVPMAVLPVGTLNHFARDMDIPLKFEEAARLAGSGVVAEVDVGEVNGRTFVNNSVIGLYPVYHLEREKRERRGWQAWLAIAGALAAVLRRYPFLNVRLSAGGFEIYRRSAYLLIANNEHAMEGFRPWVRDRMTEGMLWVYLLKDRGRLALPRLALRVLTGRFRGADDFERVRASRVVIETGRRRLGVSVDGEVMAMQSPLTFESRPRALRVLVPRGSHRAKEAPAAGDA